MKLTREWVPLPAWINEARKNKAKTATFTKPPYLGIIGLLQRNFFKMRGGG